MEGLGSQGGGPGRRRSAWPERRTAPAGADGSSLCRAGDVGRRSPAAWAVVPRWPPLIHSVALPVARSTPFRAISCSWSPWASSSCAGSTDLVGGRGSGGNFWPARWPHRSRYLLVLIPFMEALVRILPCPTPSLSMGENPWSPVFGRQRLCDVVLLPEGVRRDLLGGGGVVVA